MWYIDPERLQRDYCYQNKLASFCLSEKKKVSFAVFDSLLISEIIFCPEVVCTIKHKIVVIEVCIRGGLNLFNLIKHPLCTLQNRS